MYKVLGVSELMVLMLNSDLAWLMMIQAHREDHLSPKTTLWRSRSRVWVVHGLRTAVRVKKSCRFCILRKKKTARQQMGEVDEVKLDVTTPWTNIALDLMAPILIKAMVNKRAQC